VVEVIASAYSVTVSPRRETTREVVAKALAESRPPTPTPRHASEGDPKLAHVREVGETDLAHFVGLAEDDLLLAVDRPPGADPALQRAADSSSELRMAP
jgi:hypothetical protein